MSARRLGAAGLPSGWVATTEQAAETTGGRWLEVRAAEPVTRAVPPPGPADAIFRAARTETVPRTVVAELPAARVLGPHRAVITARGDLVQDVSYYFGTTRPREHPIFLHPFPPTPLEVSGRLGVLATRGDTNYYHFLIDVLPRLAVQAACPDLAAPHRWYVPLSTRFQRELLTLAGVDLADCLDADAHRHVRAETLVLPSPPSMTVVNPPWVVEHLRRTLIAEPIARVPGRGLYVTRGTSANNRAVTNEDEVIALVSGLGFEVMDAGAVGVAEQIRGFAEASVIVTAHGAALANIVFAGAGATVLELFPAGAVVPDYWKLTEATPGVRYRYLMGTGDPSPRDRSQMLVADITVDVPELARRLTALLDGEHCPS